MNFLSAEMAAGSPSFEQIEHALALWRQSTSLLVQPLLKRGISHGRCTALLNSTA